MLRHILVVCLVAMSRPDGRRSCSTWPQDVGLMPGGFLGHRGQRVAGLGQRSGQQDRTPETGADPQRLQRRTRRAEPGRTPGSASCRPEQVFYW